MSQNPSPQQPQQDWQPTNPPAPEPPATKKSWFARHKLLTAILAIVALVIAANALGGGDDSSTSATDAPTSQQPAAAEAPTAEPEAEPEAEPADEQPGIGDTVRDGKFEFVVTGVEDGGTEVGNEFLSEKAQGRFHFVHITVTNIGDEAQMMLDSNQKVRDEQGRTFETNSGAAIYMDDNDMWLTDINPGNTMSGTLVFDMPEGAAPVEIELHDSMFSGGVTVSLK
ncbi:MAG: DUF4352 domain-containing protein [Actinomycetia bacterium]|nr:DUF4352 domain-containing protein [Actinomycetes bacterium]